MTVLPDHQETLASAGGIKRRRRTPVVLLVVTALAGLFLYVPIIVVSWFSFNSSKSLSLFDSFSTRWYRAFFADSVAKQGILTSVQVALATTVIAVSLGTALAIGLARVRPRVQRAVDTVLLVSLVTPEIATAVALLLLFSGAGVPLSRATLIIAHVTFSIPYTVTIIRARLSGIAIRYEEAARDLGASRGQTIRLVTLPLLAPAILGAGFLVFLLSFDDFVTSFFNSGTSAQPLPLFIYGSIRFGVTPEINAIGTLVMVVTIVLGAAGMYLTSSRQRRFHT